MSRCIAAKIASVVHPAWQCSRILPSLPTETERLFTRSSCAGHLAVYCPFVPLTCSRPASSSVIIKTFTPFFFFLFLIIKPVREGGELVVQALVRYSLFRFWAPVSANFSYGCILTPRLSETGILLFNQNLISCVSFAANRMQIFLAFHV